MRRENEGIGFMPLAIGALLLSLVLVLAMDASRLFSSGEAVFAEADIWLENMDRVTAESLLSEKTLSIGTARCEVVFIGEITPQPVREITRSGRIITLPSSRRFCTHLTLRVYGKRTEDGFLASGGRRLLCGSRLTLDGKRITAEGLLLSLSLPERGEGT